MPRTAARVTPAEASGRPRFLSRARIAAAARHIVDAEGLEALTLRRVARRLGTGQASLYRHIVDRGELVALLASEVAAGLPAPPRDPDPRRRVTGQWTEAYAYLARHRWAVRVIADSPSPPDGMARFTESGLRALNALTDDPGTAARAHRLLWRLLLGRLLEENATSASGRDDFAWALPLVLDGVFGPAGR